MKSDLKFEPKYIEAPDVELLLSGPAAQSASQKAFNVQSLCIYAGKNQKLQTTVKRFPQISESPLIAIQ